MTIIQKVLVTTDERRQNEVSGSSFLKEHRDLFVLNNTAAGQEVMSKKWVTTLEKV